MCDVGGEGRGRGGGGGWRGDVGGRFVCVCVLGGGGVQSLDSPPTPPLKCFNSYYFVVRHLIVDSWSESHVKTLAGCYVLLPSYAMWEGTEHRHKPTKAPNLHIQRQQSINSFSINFHFLKEISIGGNGRIDS